MARRVGIRTRSSAGMAQAQPAWARPLMLGFVLLAGSVGTLAIADRANHAPGVYWSRSQVRLIEPRTFNPEGLAVDSSSGVIATAAVVAVQVSPRDEGHRLTSPDTTLAAAGIRHGTSVMLPNHGGQWANVFTDPWLDVQAVGTSPEEVEREMATQIAAVQQTLTEIQQEQGVAPQNLITSQLSPPRSPPLYYMDGSSKRAVAATLLLGGGLTALVLRIVRRAIPASPPTTFVHRRLFPTPAARAVTGA